MSVKSLAHSASKEASAMSLLLFFGFQEKDQFISGTRNQGLGEGVREECLSYSSSPSGLRGMVPIHLHIPVPRPVPGSQQTLLKGLLDAGFLPMASSSTPIQSWSITSHLETGFSEDKQATEYPLAGILSFPVLICPALSSLAGLALLSRLA